MTQAEQFSHDVVVIGGGGHVGLPLAIAFADRGSSVLIYDVSETAVGLVNGDAATPATLRPELGVLGRDQRGRYPRPGLVADRRPGARAAEPDAPAWPDAGSQFEHG